MIKILIVEDDAMIASGLSYALEQEGYEVKTADCVAEARQVIDRENFSMAILDITLPDGTGYELCKLIKSRTDLQYGKCQVKPFQIFC